MNVEIGTEAALFPEKKYINGIFLEVYCRYSTDNFNGQNPVSWQEMHCKWRAGEVLIYVFSDKTVQPSYLQNRIIISCLPIPTYMYLWEIYTYIPRIGLPILLQPNMWTDLGNYRQIG
jgi:hypothetical protein